MLACLFAELDLDADGDEEDGVQGEEEDSVDDDGGDAGLEVAQGDATRLGGHLEDQPRRQQDEEHERDQHGRPVLHLRSPSSIPPSPTCCCASMAQDRRRQASMAASLARSL